MTVNENPFGAELEGVSFRNRSNLLILSDLDLKFPLGKITALLGKSGSGKTTILNLLGGFLHPTSGVVKLGGEDARNLPPHKRNIGFVFQEPTALFPHLSVLRNVLFRFTINGGPTPAQRTEANQILTLLGINLKKHDKIDTLSTGEKQRVALARSLIYSPSILLLDEPTAALDNSNSSNLLAHLRQLHQRKPTTTVFVTHDEREACEIADYLGVLEGGRVSQFGTPQQLRMEPTSRSVATLMRGWNFIDGTKSGATFSTKELGLKFELGGIPGGDVADGECCVAFPIALPEHTSSSGITIEGKVAAIEYQEFANLITLESPFGPWKIALQKQDRILPLHSHLKQVIDPLTCRILR
jgi:ABC-type Fe3+/spermidine/putrescine transport system ATPase subunit